MSSNSMLQFYCADKLLVEPLVNYMKVTCFLLTSYLEINVDLQLKELLMYYIDKLVNLLTQPDYLSAHIYKKSNKKHISTIAFLP